MTTYTYKAVCVDTATEEEKNNTVDSASEKVAASIAKDAHYSACYNSKTPTEGFGGRPLGYWGHASMSGTWLIVRYPFWVDPATKIFDHLVVSLDSDKAPSRLMTAKQAHVVAGKMADEHRGKRFYVAKLVEYAEAAPIPEVVRGKL